MHDNFLWSKVDAIRNRTGIDRPIAFTLLARFWSSVAGAITVVLIAKFLSLQEQGYYYTFFSVAGFQVVFELGFSYVVLQMAAHERAHVAIDSRGNIEGPPVALGRLASVLQKSVRWYSIAAVLMATTLIPLGMRLFRVGQLSLADTEWMIPWCLLVLAVSLNFQLDALCSFIEGCGFVSEIAQMRFVQAVAGSALAWAAMSTHHGLFAPAMMIVGNGIVQIAYLSQRQKRGLLTRLLRHNVGSHSVSWKQEIWPFQWRVAVTWLCSYSITQLIIPVVFLYEGAELAGRMGMSISVAAALATIGMAWIRTKASVYGALIARGERRRSEQMFFRALRQSTILVAAGAGFCFLMFLIVASRFPQVSARLLPPWAFCLLLLTTIMIHVVSSEGMYLRAQKREPLLIPSLMTAFGLALSALLLGRFWGIWAVMLSYFGFCGVVSLAWSTYVFKKERRSWCTREDAVCGDRNLTRDLHIAVEPEGGTFEND